jgi:hypothetical protein
MKRREFITLLGRLAARRARSASVLSPASFLGPLSAISSVISIQAPNLQIRFPSVARKPIATRSFA